MRVLFCGDRNWSDEGKIKRVLQRLRKQFCGTIIIVEGEARGADSIAGRLAREMGFDVEGYPAQWGAYGRAAGPRRNQQMIDESARKAETDGHKLRMAFAFHPNIDTSKGTKDMVRRLTKHHIPCKVIA